ncbi:DUF1127 domain-containing protein [Pseudothauera rhizosphaerae]|uniref:DUF1127 domain-containing protein n=1 Tax=Pseudothauera rhizosphaerae TaxID=2565932 RepID=A0A4S4AQW6_9RHOO|nr:DUF1127 domain-containing protein [Pseudothauera rhizosphaerae]THF62172.1 DUF1127 domain-containing protein [Pseudothauera rhizosphaerae]
MMVIELLRRLEAAIRALLQRRQGRRELLELDERLLRDVGISREQARREAAKPFWRQ